MAAEAGEERIAECERLLDMAEKAINEQSQTIHLLSGQNERLREALDEEIMRSVTNQTAWYERPMVVAPLSLLLGFVIGSRVMQNK